MEPSRLPLCSSRRPVVHRQATRDALWFSRRRLAEVILQELDVREIFGTAGETEELKLRAVPSMVSLWSS